MQSKIQLLVIILYGSPVSIYVNIKKPLKLSTDIGCSVWGIKTQWYQIICVNNKTQWFTTSQARWKIWWEKKWMYAFVVIFIVCWSWFKILWFFYKNKISVDTEFTYYFVQTISFFESPIRCSYKTFSEEYLKRREKGPLSSSLNIFFDYGIGKKIGRKLGKNPEAAYELFCYNICSFFPGATFLKRCLEHLKFSRRLGSNKNTSRFPGEDIILF